MKTAVKEFVVLKSHIQQTMHGKTLWFFGNELSLIL